MLKKYCLPIATRIFSQPPLNCFPKRIEAICAALQSRKGGGFDAQWQEITNALQFIRSPTPLIFDIGANSGHWAKGISRTGKERIIMFEPQAACWPELAKIINNNISLEKVAMSDHEGVLSFYTTANTEIASATARSDFGDKFETTEVACSTVDAYVTKHSIQFIDFIKMDVEGHEMFCLKGAYETLAQKRIGAISFEFGLANVNSRTFFIDYYNFLTNIGYAIYRVGHDGVPIALRSYSRSAEYFDGVSNYIASIEPPKRFRYES